MSYIWDRRRRTNSARMGFSPLSLFANDEVGFFYPMTPGTVYQEDSFTTPSEIGDPIGGIRDMSGNGNDLTQTTAASRPVYARHPLSGARSLVNNGRDLTAATWSTSGSASVVDATTVNFSTTSDEVEGDAVEFTAPDTSATFQLSVLAWTDEPTDVGKDARLRVQITNDGSTAFSTHDFTLTAEPVLHTLEYTTGEIFTAGETYTIVTQLRPDNDGTVPSEVSFTDIMTEIGAAATNYQNRISQYDISESGFDYQYGPYFDGVDDSLINASVDLSTVSSFAVIHGFRMLTRLGTQHALNHNKSAKPNFTLRTSYNATNYLARMNVIGATTGSNTGIAFSGEGPYDEVFLSTVDLVAPSNYLELVGQTATDTSVTGSVLFTTGQLAMGQSGQSSSFFEGVIWPMTFVGRTLTTEELSDLRDWTTERTPGAS